MADHTRLWNHFILAVRGSKEAKHQNVGGGSVNYRLIDDTTAWILDPSPENRLTLLGHFANMKRTGHMSLAGPKGVACEQGSPAAHRKFNMAPLLAIFKFARERGDNELALAAEAVILDEVGLTQAFMFKGTSVIPAPRVKDEKGQGPVDVNRDRLSWVLRGADLRKIKTGKSFWKDDEGNLDVILARELVESRVWDDELIVMAIHSDDTPENRKVMGRDGCHFVHAAPDGIWWRVDWEPELDAEGKSNNHHLKKKGKRNE
jgi:hypothetical protein